MSMPTSKMALWNFPSFQLTWHRKFYIKISNDFVFHTLTLIVLFDLTTLCYLKNHAYLYI